MSKEAINKLLEAVIELERSIREAESYVKSVQAELVKRADSIAAQLSQEADVIASEASRQLEELYKAEASRIEADLARRLEDVERDLRERADKNFERAVQAVIEAVKRIASGG